MERKPVGVKFDAVEPEKNEKIFNKQGDGYQSERTRKGGEEGERGKKYEKNRRVGTDQREGWGRNGKIR